MQDQNLASRDQKGALQLVGVEMLPKPLAFLALVGGSLSIIFPYEGRETMLY